MNTKLFGRNTAAVSLIEIMMIFTIIGVVTTACVSLAKPKYEYMKKIKVYSALEMLENAARIIQNEGSIDYTTDINTCRDRDSSTKYCNDYNGKYPYLSNQLPKASYRTSYELLSTLNNTIYRNFKKEEQNQFVNLQRGLCERLQKVITTQGYAQQSCSAANLIEDSNPDAVKTSGYFKNRTPQIILPNGQAIYMSKNLYTDIAKVRYTVKAAKETNYDTTIEECVATNCGLSSYINNLYNNDLKIQPNETRLAAATAYYNEYLLNLYARNKDYFVIYVDTNCQWNNQSDSKLCGPDTLNDDVFAFRMYRDGMVIPDPSSVFPENMLTAKILLQDANAKGFNNQYGNYAPILSYTNLPLNAARCYANLMCNGINNSAICSICNNYANVTTPLSECTNSNGDTNCKVIINKPSFIMR